MTVDRDEVNNVGSRRAYFASTANPKKSRRMSALSFLSKRKNTMSRGMLASRSIKPDADLGDVGTFRNLPPFEAFTKFSWISVIAQILVGIGGTVSSNITEMGDIGGVMSGIFGLWFVQMAWVMSLPSKCSTLPYLIGLCMLPFWKSVGFLLEPTPNWHEFMKRMLILIFMWCLPMWLAGDTTAEVVRCMHGDVSRYKNRNSLDSNTIYGFRYSQGTPVDLEGVSIRERAMACTVKYIMILPIVVYITFNSVGALIETKEYAKYGAGADFDDEFMSTFEFRTGRQFYVDYMRLFYSNIFQGLVTVFTMITISAFSCSAMDLGEVMIFRFHRWEIVAICGNVLFFVAGVYFGSAVFDPTLASNIEIAYWSIWALPCFLMFSLYWLTRTVLYGKNNLTKKRVESNEYIDEIEEFEMPHKFSDFMDVKPWASFKMQKSDTILEEEMEDEDEDEVHHAIEVEFGKHR